MNAEMTKIGKGSDGNLLRYQQAKRKRRLLRRLILPVFAGILLVILIWLILRTVFVVKTMDVIGASDYTEEEILAAAGIQYKDSIFSVSEKEVNRRLCAEFPYIKNVVVKKELPSGIVLEIVEEHTTFYTELAEEFFLFNSSLRLMDRFDSEKSLLEKRPTAICTKIPIPKSCIAPQYIRFSDDNEYVMSVFQALSAWNLVRGISQMDLTDRYRITLSYQNSIEILLGESSDFEKKLAACSRLIHDAGEGASGHIDMSDFPRIFYQLEKSDGS